MPSLGAVRPNCMGTFLTGLPGSQSMSVEVYCILYIATGECSSQHAHTQNDVIMQLKILQWEATGKAAVIIANRL